MVINSSRQPILWNEALQQDLSLINVDSKLIQYTCVLIRQVVGHMFMIQLLGV